MKKERIIALLAAVLLLSAALFACVPAGDANGEETTVPVDIDVPAVRDTLILPFARQDVLNPYRVATELNLELATLLYEGLFTTDAMHAPRPVLAESITQNSPTQFTIALQERQFHNGRRATPADVIYSWERARDSQNFRARVENISAMRERDGQLEITLSRANVFIAANLDFPIVPEGSANYGPLQQARGGYHFTLARTPYGTGRYRLVEEDGVFTLQHDANHPDAAPALMTIELFGINNTAALLNGLEMGNYHFAFYNLSGGELPRVSAATFRVPTTNLVFLGLNAARGSLQNPNLRAALAACLNTSSLLSDAFQGFAESTNTPFPANWHGLEGHELDRAFNATNARQGLEALGYNELRGGVRSAGNRSLSFNLVVRRDRPAMMAAAGLIRTQLAAFQIEVNIRALDREAYNEAVRAGNFDMYLGELRLTPDIGLSPLLITGGAATRGIQLMGRASSAYGQFRQGLVTAEHFVEVFLEDMPFIPLGYRAGMAAAVRSLRIPVELRRNDLFAEILDWNF